MKMLDEIDKIWYFNKKCNRKKILFIKKAYGLGGEIKMLNDEICVLRNKLNDSILHGEDYDVIYKISVELDELIAQYYRK